MSFAKWRPFSPGGYELKQTFIMRMNNYERYFCMTCHLCDAALTVFSCLGPATQSFFVSFVIENPVCSNFYSTGLVRSHICTYLESSTVVASAKLWPDRIIYFCLMIKNQLTKQWNGRWNLTDHRWNCSQKLQQYRALLLFCCSPEYALKETVELLMIWDAKTLTRRNCMVVLSETHGR